MNIVFAGTPEFALPCLNAVAESSHRLTGVLTQPDRPAGRGRKLATSPVKQRALELGVPVQQPLSLKKDDAFEDLAALEPDLMVVVAYGLLLPKKVLALPRYGCINVHASLLPRWRGAAPIARAILAGDSESGVTLMQMNAGLDTGPMLARRAVEIGSDTTAGELHDRLAELGAAELSALLGRVEQGVTGESQDDAQACYARRLDKGEAAIDWRLRADEIARAVRAFVPWPVAHARLGGQPIRFWRAGTAPTSAGASAEPGTVVAASPKGIDIATGAGTLRVTELQLPGKKRMDAAAAVNGRAWVGQRFE
ncbi:Methionyl-tRNA formyltransferase protein [Salinisphaera shabanensis E1L3A]|uniref:Methionyl-tRNA formyltransferase n=1 Tax=Salinisphaera shabanensis E1L3A TaxID=1033802 RepID=U2FND5_9GAMM|nr:methionyl-tRNA formyltransferase [Salinisphaera shabanensis]ERJ17709.1 Methionyl-tRNA formyltransferase protein [Salinisphaera shabanensis E1L3A]